MYATFWVISCAPLTAFWAMSLCGNGSITYRGCIINLWRATRLGADGKVENSPDTSEVGQPAHPAPREWYWLSCIHRRLLRFNSHSTITFDLCLVYIISNSNPLLTSSPKEIMPPCAKAVCLLVWELTVVIYGDLLAKRPMDSQW